MRERRFLRNLDVCLIIWAWFAYLIKGHKIPCACELTLQQLIDVSNYKTAYATGMKRRNGGADRDPNCKSTASRTPSQRPSRDEKVDASGKYDPRCPFGSLS
jgi:hypothetical protein